MLVLFKISSFEVKLLTLIFGCFTATVCYNSNCRVHGVVIRKYLAITKIITLTFHYTRLSQNIETNQLCGDKLVWCIFWRGLSVGIMSHIGGIMSHHNHKVIIRYLIMEIAM